tara:strand:+ start:747 stop:1841 length:1095 start_codon:yes stop_codon:yes gene_type:complete
MKTNLIFFLARFGFGGAGNSVYKLCRALNKKKYNISIICLNKCAYESNLRKAGIKIFKIKSKKVLFAIFKVQKISCAINNSLSKTVFISNINYTNILSSMFIKKKKNFKLIGIERTPLKELEIYFSVIDFVKKNLMKLLIFLFYGNFDKIVCNSKYLGNYLKKKYGFNSVTIFPPSLNKVSIFNKKRSLAGKIYITTICRLSKEKKIEDIIYAINYLKNKNILLNIIGTGPEESKLIKIVNKLNLSKQIKFYGYKENVFKYLNKSDLYINSSYFEGFPNSVVEAAYMGVPIISSQSHGGINEILHNGKYGTIYNGNYINLALKIKNFYKNPKIFYKKANLAKKNVLNFNVSNHKLNFERLIDKI